MDPDPLCAVRPWRTNGRATSGASGAVSGWCCSFAGVPPSPDHHRSIPSSASASASGAGFVVGARGSSSSSRPSPSRPPRSIALSSSSSSPSSLSLEQRRHADTNLALARTRAPQPPPRRIQSVRRRREARGAARGGDMAGGAGKGSCASLRARSVPICRPRADARQGASLPAAHLVFHALHTTPFNNVKAVIIGQVLCVFFLYIWCAAADPADPGVFKSKKYLRLYGSCKHKHLKESIQGVSDVGLQLEETGEKKEREVAEASEKIMTQQKSSSCCAVTYSAVLLIFYPLPFVFSCCQSREWSSEQQDREEGIFFCSLCEVEVLKYNKHCRVCDKCVDGFDHHCRITYS